MNTVHPWLDADEVRLLAQRLLQPPQTPASIQGQEPDSAFGGSFEGFMAAPPQHAATQKSAPITENPGESTGLPAIPTLPMAAREIPINLSQTPPPASDIAQQQPPAASKSQKTHGPTPETNPILRFRDWMSEQFSATGLFILDHQGDVLFDEGTHGRLHFLARSLAQAQRNPSDTDHHVHVKISVRSTLEIIPVDITSGRHVLGAVVTQPLDQPSVRAIMQALESALADRG